jgi:hypothetical protein
VHLVTQGKLIYSFFLKKNLDNATVHSSQKLISQCKIVSHPHTKKDLPIQQLVLVQPYWETANIIYRKIVGDALNIT